MSGPKVVRIVTREEIEAICHRHIATVEAASREFSRRARRCGRFDGVAEQALAERIAALKAMLARDEWMAVQKGAPETIGFLKAESDRLERGAVDEATRARERRRRTMDAARSIASALQAAGVPVDRALELTAAGRAPSIDKAEQAIAAGLAAVPRRGRSTGGAADQAELAGRLSAGERSQTLSDLVPPPRLETLADEQRVDALLAELHVLGGAAASFVLRADAIAVEQDALRRRLLTDSLVMDAAAQVALVRRREAIDGSLRQAAASLEGVDTPEAKALRARLDSSLGQADQGMADGLCAEAAAMQEAHLRALAAAARRRVVLSGLSSLGYEVREGMASAWERNGRVVVRKPGATDYGVELGAPADAARFQVRLVGSTTPRTLRDARRDADQETIWCGEFDRLRAGLSANGEEVVLERAVEAGTMPLRSVEMPIEAAPAAARESRPLVGRRVTWSCPRAWCRRRSPR